MPRWTRFRAEQTAACSLVWLCCLFSISRSHCDAPGVAPLHQALSTRRGSLGNLSPVPHLSLPPRGRECDGRALFLGTGL